MVKTPLIGVLGSGHVFNRKTTIADITMPISKIIQSVIPCISCGNTDIDKFSIVVSKRPFKTKAYSIKCLSCGECFQVGFQVALQDSD